MSKGQTKKTQEVAQEFELKDEYTEVLARLGSYSNKIPEVVINEIAKEGGLETSDLNVIKLLGLLGDKLIFDVCESLLQQQPPQLQTAEVEKPDNQDGKEKSKPSKSQKEKNLNNKTFTVANIVDELNERGHSVHKFPYTPDLRVTNTKSGS